MANNVRVGRSSVDGATARPTSVAGSIMGPIAGLLNAAKVSRDPARVIKWLNFVTWVLTCDEAREEPALLDAIVPVVHAAMTSGDPGGVIELLNSVRGVLLCNEAIGVPAQRASFSKRQGSAPGEVVAPRVVGAELRLMGTDQPSAAGERPGDRNPQTAGTEDKPTDVATQFATIDGLMGTGGAHVADEHQCLPDVLRRTEDVEERLPPVEPQTEHTGGQSFGQQYLAAAVQDPMTSGHAAARCPPWHPSCLGDQYVEGLREKTRWSVPIEQLYRRAVLVVAANPDKFEGFPTTPADVIMSALRLYLPHLAFVVATREFHAEMGHKLTTVT